MSMDTDYEYFQNNLDSYLVEHNGEYVVIKDRQVLGFYDNKSNALRDTLKNHLPGSFIVQLCLPAEQLVQTFTRAYF